MKTRAFVVVGCVVMGILISVVLVFQKPIRIAYHRSKMESAWATYNSTPKQSDGYVFYDDENALEQYEYHRDRLVDLGHLTHAQFVFPHEDAKEIHRWLWDRIRASFPDNRHPTLKWPENMLEVWDRPENIPNWQRFVEKTREEISVLPEREARESPRKPESPQ